ncbi:MAG: ATP synthase F1 subunit delta, partial [Clostridia bacterium]|nr:ATP synthase F1 subunit delta [Clostridia bacterium]
MSELEGRYARALFELTQNEAELRRAAGVLTGSAPLYAALENPCIAQGEKEAVLDAALAESSPLLRSFFKLLCGHGRLAFLPGILDAYHGLILASHNALDAVMRSAFVPSEAEKSAISAALAAKYGKDHVELRVISAPQLMGGFTLTVGNDTYDKSVLGAVRELKNVVDRAAILCPDEV